MKILLSLLCLYHVYAGELASQTAIATHHFSHWLDRGVFFNDSSLEKVNFVSSAFGFPDLPSWLHLVPSKSRVGTYLYGSPQTVHDATKLQIVATNADNMKTVFHTMDIKVAPKAVPAKHLVELRVLDHDLEQMLHPDVTRDLLSRVQTVWPRGGDVYIKKITPPMKVESEGASNGALGVVVTIGGTRPFSDDLRRAVAQRENAGCGSNYQPEKISIHRHFAPDFNIDWCALKLTETRSNDVKPAPATSRPDILSSDDDMVMWRKRPRREYFIDFMVTVILPCVLAAVIVLILAYVMFGRREGLFKRNEKTSEEQLTQFNTIRRATANLRLFSDHRDSPHPLRIDPSFPLETYYMDTLPRKNLLSTNRPSPGTYSTAKNQQTP